jgi:hypothetical protein
MIAARSLRVTMSEQNLHTFNKNLSFPRTREPRSVEREEGAPPFVRSFQFDASGSPLEFTLRPRFARTGARG